MLKFLAKRWLLMLALIAVALVLKAGLNVGSSRRANHINELISAGNYVEAVQYVSDIGRKKFNIKEEEQAYIDVFVAALPGEYRGTVNGGEYIYIYVPGDIGYSVSFYASAKYHYTLSDYKKESRFYLFTSSALYESGEAIREAALSDASFRYDYRYLELKYHEYDHYKTDFRAVPANQTDKTLSSFSYNVKNRKITYSYANNYVSLERID